MTTTPWNKGLTKETDNRVARYSEKLKGKILTEDHRRRLSELKKGKYVGKDNHFYGRDHSNEAIKKIVESGYEYYFNKHGHPGHCFAICEVCGEAFKLRFSVIKQRTQFCCSRKCGTKLCFDNYYERGNVRKVFVLCEICGKPVEKYISDFILHEHVTCGKKECSAKTFLMAMEKPKAYIQCAYCKKLKEIGSGQINRLIKTYGAIYCSKKCQHLGNKKFHVNTGETANNFTGEIYFFSCAWCGDIQSVRLGFRQKLHSFFFEKKETLSDMNLSFCNSKCLGKYRSKYFVGINHPCYTGGKFPYYGNNWLRQKRSALKKAGYKSEISGNVSMLDVHHIYKRREFIDVAIDLFYKPFISDMTRYSFKILPAELIPDLLYEEMNRDENLFVVTRNEHKIIENKPPSFFREIKCK